METSLQELRSAALTVLREADPGTKCAGTHALAATQARGALTLDLDCSLVAPAVPGRPARPKLVHPARVPRRRIGTPEGRAALLHAIAHIEFNAINLALDALVRFSGLPAAFYTDWLNVAAEEASHFELLAARLADLGSFYGALPAHDGLWEAAAKTRHDPLARMALVPRILEARGLDVTPGLQARLRAVGDEESAQILEIILRDEVGHVAIGNRWYGFLCSRAGLSPEDTFIDLCRQFGVRSPQPPFNHPARIRAGFAAAELADLEMLAGAAPRS
jgi:uncharacterized ferritin-like protein (DUF455 family)